MILTKDETKSSRIAEIFRRKMMTGEIVPGSKLEGENQLADRFQVGRQVIRSAFRVLKEENLIRSARGGGTYVNDYIPSDLASKNIRVGCVYWRNNLRENSFLHSYHRILLSAREKGCEIFLTCEDNPSALVEWVRNYRLDGLLIAGYVDDVLIRELNREKILFLLMGNYELTEPANRLEKDVYSHVRDAMVFLIRRNGFRCISGIFSNLSHLGPRQALAGIRAAAVECGICFREESFLCMEDGNGYQAMERLFAEKKLGSDDLVYLSEVAFPGAARSIFERRLPPVKRPYLFLDMPVSEVPYPDLVGCFLYEEDAYAAQALDCLLDIYSGRLRQPWQGYVDCRVGLPRKIFGGE